MAQAKDSGISIVRKAIPFVIVAFVLALVLIVRALSRSDGAPIRAARATRQDLVTSVVTNGKIEPIQSYDAHSPAALVVRKVLVQAGAHVEAGQLLMQLDDTDAVAALKRAQADLLTAQASAACVENGGGCTADQLTNRADLTKAQNELTSAKQNLATLQKLQSTGAATEAEVQAAQSRITLAQQQVDLIHSRMTGSFSSLDRNKAAAQVKQAEAEVQQAKHLFDKTNIRAPFAGTVYFIGFKESELANANELLLQVADLSKVQVRAFVDEPEIGHLSVGDPVVVHWDALPNQTWKGTLTEVPSSITNYGTRNVGQALCQIDNTGARLIPNVNVTVTITTSHEQNALTVPRESMHIEGDQRYVYVVEHGRLRRTDVTVGASNLTTIEVKNGVSDGAQVAIGALNSQPLRDGMEVHVVHQ